MRGARETCAWRRSVAPLLRFEPLPITPRQAFVEVVGRRVKGGVRRDSRMGGGKREASGSTNGSQESASRRPWSASAAARCHRSPRAPPQPQCDAVDKRPVTHHVTRHAETRAGLYCPLTGRTSSGVRTRSPDAAVLAAAGSTGRAKKKTRAIPGVEEQRETPTAAGPVSSARVTQVEQGWWHGAKKSAGQEKAGLRQSQQEDTVTPRHPRESSGVPLRPRAPPTGPRCGGSDPSLSVVRPLRSCARYATRPCKQKHASRHTHLRGRHNPRGRHTGPAGASGGIPRARAWKGGVQWSTGCL